MQENYYIKSTQSITNKIMKVVKIIAYEWHEISADAQQLAAELTESTEIEKMLFSVQGCPLVDPTEVREFYQPKEGENFARKCSITQEGMNSGYVWHGGTLYAKNLCDTMAILKEDFNMREGQTEEELLQWAYNEGELYYTEWDIESDAQYIFTNGELIEIED